MPDINIGQQGKLRSMPKITKINGDDYLALVYRNMGNNHAYPFVWAETVTFSGTEYELLASGTKFHGMAAATYCRVNVTPLSNPGAALFWIDKSNATVTIKSTAAYTGDIDVMVMVGESPDVEAIACRGNTGAAQMLP